MKYFIIQKPTNPIVFVTIWINGAWKVNWEERYLTERDSGHLTVEAADQRKEQIIWYWGFKRATIEIADETQAKHLLGLRRNRVSL